MGFEDCPWCKEALPIIMKVAKSERVQVSYFDTAAEDTKVNKPSFKFFGNGNPFLYIHEIVSFQFCIILIVNNPYPNEKIDET